MGNENPSSVLTDLDLLAPKPSAGTTSTDEWHFGKSTAPVALNKEPQSGSDGSQLRRNKRHRGRARGRKGAGEVLTCVTDPSRAL